MKCVDLSKFSNKFYKPAGSIKKGLWWMASVLLFKSPLPCLYGFKKMLLMIFGAKIGKRFVIKPNVKIKYPWFLEAGDDVWIGEGVWIDNLTMVRIGNNVCISQGVYVMTGSHDYKKETFDLVLKEVSVKDGAWIGAMSVVCLGVTINECSVINAGSVVTKDTTAYTIYHGVPAIAVRKRVID
ncbi:MAG: WcaF family extracellular polysaccharide biosynthesis acetyltransferase [Candidatus Omnitrophota bacterium]|jgi:putative colanic acid biosynthesis acetyltransferase WcaF